MTEGPELLGGEKIKPGGSLRGDKAASRRIITMSVETMFCFFFPLKNVSAWSPVRHEEEAEEVGGWGGGVMRRSQAVCASSNWTVSDIYSWQQRW